MAQLSVIFGPNAKATPCGSNLLDDHTQTERMMKARHILAGALLVAVPVAVSSGASAQTANTPKYPPGFDCAAVPAGSERESCNQSQLNPNTDNNGIIDPADPGNAGGAIQTPSDIGPPTVPNSPGNNTGNNGGIGETNPTTP